MSFFSWLAGMLFPAIILAICFFGGLLSAQVSANFVSTSPTACGSLFVGFTDLSSGSVTSWEWDFGNGNTSNAQSPATSYNVSGNYTVTLIVSDGSQNDTLTRTNYIQVFQNPTASFSTNLNLGCQPLQITFTNSSTAGTAPISTSTWDFGDGIGSSGLNAAHTYNSAGTFTPILYIVDTNGCTSNSNASSIQILPPIVANFGLDSNITCGFPFLVQFSDSSAGPGPISYAWDFGDGNTSNSQNPAHNYIASGDKDVALIVSNPAGCADTLTQLGLIQEDSLVAQLSSNTTTPCIGFPVQFQGSSIGNAITWAWDFGDGNSSNLQNPVHTYSNSGSFTVALTVTNALGCTHTISQSNYISISSAPVASFNVTNGQACEAPLLVSFGQNSTNAASFEWDFGDGSTSSLPAPSHNYTLPGQYAVTLIATNVQGCKDTLTLANAVSIDPPIAAFTSTTPQRGCRPLTYKFNDASTTSSGTINFHSWDFGDGFNSTAPNPNHTYTFDGNYTVTYIVGTTTGCFDTLISPNYITVATQPTSSFTISDNNPCFGDSVIYTNTSTGGATSYLWDFGDGNTSTLVSPTYAFQDTGCFNVNLYASNGGCIDSLGTPQVVCVKGVIPWFTRSQSASCTFPVTINFTDQSQGSNLVYRWDFDDGSSSTLANPSHTFTAKGTYRVRLTIGDTVAMCSTSVRRPIRIGGPTANFVADQNIGCADLPVTFGDSTGDATSWLWDFGDGNSSLLQHPTHIYDSAGIYDVALIVQDNANCRDTLLVNSMITVNNITATFDASRRPACVAENISFSDNSITSGTSTNWQWDFGDGSPLSSATNPSHSYGNEGLYTIKLITEDNNGCIDSITVPNFINILKPITNFSRSDTNLCPDENLVLTNNSGGLSPLSYSWDFGDGSSSTLQNPNHSYSSSGNYVISLTTTDSAGCVQAISQPMSISSPIAAYSITDSVSNCPPLIVGFTEMAMGNIANYQWSFGDGATSILPNPNHSYGALGSYDVQMIVSTPTGCADTLLNINEIRVGQPNNIFSFNQTATCVGQNIQFVLTSNQPLSPIWDFGDGNVMFSGDTVSHSYSSPGSYAPVLTVVDTTGCQNTVPASSILQVLPSPMAALNISDSILCPGDSINLADNSAYGAPLAGIFWDFGNGNSGGNTFETEAYSTPGYYDISMRILDSLGCSDSILVPNAVRVFGTQANFSILPSVACANTPLNFNSASTSDTTLTQWNWIFGDSLTGSGDSVLHSYSTAGNYDVALHVTNIIGCEDSIIIANALNIATPNGSFFFAPELICEGDSTFFTFIGDPGVVPTWYFGDGDSAVGGDTIWHQYTVAGIYTPQVLMTDSLGCTAFTPSAGNVRALPLPQALIWADTNQLCRYDTLRLADSTNYTSAPGTVDWSFGDGNTGTGSSASHFYSNSGTYDIIMNVTDALGCRGSDTLSNTIRILSIQADFYADDTAICNPQTVQFSDTSSSDTTIVAWSWSFGDGNTGVGSPTSNTYSSNDLFDVSLIVTDAVGCMDTVTKPKFIQANLPEVPQIYAASVAGDELVAINVAPTTNPLFKEYEVYGVSGPGSYFYIDNGAHINNGLIFDDQSNTLYASICYRALTQDVCDNKSDLDSAISHCTMELTAIPTNDAVDLVWSGYIGWDTILRYDIMIVSGYDTATSNVQHIGSVSGTTTTFTDSSFVCSERRIYRIRAIGSISQEISWSDTSATRPILTASPEAPEIIVATVQNNTDIQIDWAPGNLVGHTAYDLERSLDNSTWTPIGSYPNTTLQFIDQQVDVATQSYYYRISAIDACGLTTPYSNLGQSILLNIDASGNTPIFQWNAYQEWGAIDHYEIEEQPSAGGSWSLVTSLPASSTSYTHTQGSQNAGGTCYRIRAFEFGGNQAISTSNEICFGESLWIPNTLTPNGDGLNDVWIIQGLSNYESATVDIYNRWGNLIYESSDYQNDWLGTNSKSNETLPDGTYFYVLKLSDGQTLRGQVTIMR